MSEGTVLVPPPPEADGNNPIPAESFKPPADFYVGTLGGDPEDIATARKDRERGFTRRLREAREEAREKGDTAKEQEITKTLLQAYDYFRKQRLAGGDFPGEVMDHDSKE